MVNLCCGRLPGPRSSLSFAIITAQAARANKVRHFVLLSAICVQKPLLEFQRAKLKFENELMAAGDITYSIVRPTAFFKSLAGQVLMPQGLAYFRMGQAFGWDEWLWRSTMSGREQGCA